MRHYKYPLLFLAVLMAISILSYWSSKEKLQVPEQKIALLEENQANTENAAISQVSIISKPSKSKTKNILPKDVDVRHKPITEEEQDEEEQKRNSFEEFLKDEYEMTKDPATGRVPRFAAYEALIAAKKAKEFQLPKSAVGENSDERALPTVNITARGPNNFGGRTRMLGIDSRNNNILIAGGNSGAIMRSTDGGNSWVNVHPAGQINSIQCVAQDPRSGFQDTWYLGSGEPGGGSASETGAGYLGHGILKSTDNGINWAPIASTQMTLESFDSEFDAVSKIVISPTNGNIYAAVSDAIYVSVDNGITWTKMLGNGNASNYTDIIKTSDNTYYAAISGDGIWKSNNASPAQASDWTKIAGVGASNTLGAGFQRIVLASSAANANLVYAFYRANFTCGPSTSQVRLERYDAGGAGSWTDYNNAISDCSSISGTKVITPQGNYNMAIAVKPDNANLVYLGGTEIYRFNATNNDYVFIGGDQGSPSGTNLHVDCHYLFFSDNNTLWSTNDGGIHKTNVTGSIAAAPQGFTWDRKTTGYNGYQFYRADISPVNGSAFVGGGAQDNANLIIPVSTTNGIEIGGGDGVQHAIITGTNSTDYNVLTSTQGGTLIRRTPNDFHDVKPAGQNGEFKTYFLLDKDNTNYLYYPTLAGTKLFRTRIASTITSDAITSDANTGYEEMTAVPTAIGGVITSMASSYNMAYAGAAYSNSNNNRKLYIATGTQLFRLNDPAFCAANTAPINLSAPNVGNISDIAVNPFDDNEILLTYSNYNVVSIYHTTNANTASPTWTAVEGSSSSAVGKASIRSALIIRSGTSTLYFVGTSTGLYATDALNGGSTVWDKVGGATSEIGFSPCVSMRLRTSDNSFVVGTHGSGLFQLFVPQASLPIELVAFTGSALLAKNLLTWSTASETNNKGFEIERSSDGSRFDKIGFVGGNGTTTKTQRYNFEDSSPFERSGDVLYYRLKQLDNDGHFEYSKIIAITRTDKNKVSVFPNPSNGLFTITGLEDTNNDGLTVINSIGQTLNVTIQNNGQLDLTTFESGIYFLKIASTKEVLKLIKN